MPARNDQRMPGRNREPVADDQAGSVGVDDPLGCQEAKRAGFHDQLLSENLQECGRVDVILSFMVFRTGSHMTLDEFSFSVRHDILLPDGKVSIACPPLLLAARYLLYTTSFHSHGQNHG